MQVHPKAVIPSSHCHRQHKINFRSSHFLQYLLILGFVYLSCSHSNPFYAPSTQTNTDTIAYLDEEIRSRLLLIGDAGEPETSQDLLANLTFWASRVPEKTTLIFLGDNIYPNGLRDKDRAKGEKRLQLLMKIPVTSGVRALFIPGNHDWNHGDRASLLQQQTMVTRVLGDSSFLPCNACPGPAMIKAKGVKLIAFDSEWFLMKHEHVDSSCTPQDLQSFAHKLRECMNQSVELPIILLAHHPLVTYGSHGGFRSWREHVFPLTASRNWLWIPMPIVGSLFWGVRTFFPGNQDLREKRYARLIDTLENVVSDYKGSDRILYAAGHDHSLQVIEQKNVHLLTIVSGAGSKSKITQVTNGEGTLFAHEHSGFVVLDYLKNKDIILHIIEDPTGQAVFSYRMNKNKTF